MNRNIRIDLLSHAHHLNQPLTGFYYWAKVNGYDLNIRDCSRNDEYKVKKTAMVVSIDHHRLVYDMADGYQSPNATEYLLGCSDFYFKRSFSEKINREMGYHRIYPYGLNYDVTWAGNPISGYRKLGWLRTAWESLHGTMITPERIEQIPTWQDGRIPRILFMTRLWPEDHALTSSENEERREINETRIRILRMMTETFPDQVIGGLADGESARALAPDLIVPHSLTKRYHYIEAMRQADICVATTGLHGSIGGRIGEYVAASRAVVTERLRYTVPGDFHAGKNYLEFETPDQCMEQIRFLIDHPKAILTMQKNNRAYYQNYLKPDRLIQNTLEIAGIKGKSE